MNHRPIIIALAGLALATSFSRGQTPREADTPPIVQVTTKPNDDQLPDDGGSFCVPTSTTMSLYYLSAMGFTGVAPQWDKANPDSSSNLSQAYNLDRIISGMVYTSPYKGTSPTYWVLGMQTYLNLMGYAGSGTAARSSPTDFGDVMAAVQNPNAASVLMLTWEYADGSAKSGHGLALVGATTGTSGSQVTLNNPEPSALIAGTPDVPGNVQQTFNVGSSPLPNLPAGMYVETPDNPLPRYGLISTLLTITIDPTAASAPPALFVLDAPLVIGTNGGNLTALAPLSGVGGIDKRAAGTLTLSGFNQTTGTNAVQGGTLASVFTSSGSSAVSPFGEGSMAVSGGSTLAFTPALSDTGDAILTVAGGTDSQLTVTGGMGTLLVRAGSNSSLSLTVGGYTSGTTHNLDVREHATLLVDAGVPLADLGQDVRILVAGGAGNRPHSDGKMVRPAIVGLNTDETLGFLDYKDDQGFIAATTLKQNSFQNAAGSIVETSASFDVDGAVAADALIANADIGSAGQSSISLGSGDEAGLILNGAAISVDEIHFAGRGFIFAGGTQDSSISSRLVTDGGGPLILSNAGSGVLALSSEIAGVEEVAVDAGKVQVNHVRSNIYVEQGSTLIATGSLTAETHVAASGTLLLAGGTISGPLHLTADSASYTETYVPGSVLAGQGTVHLSHHQELSGAIGRGTAVDNLLFTLDAAGSEIFLNGPFMFTLASLASDGTGTPGIDWSSYQFMGESGTLYARNDAVDVSLNFLPGMVPNLNEEFWRTEQSWTVFTLAPGITLDPSVNWVVSNQNIFSFAETGQFSMTEPGVLQWTPIPEPKVLTTFVIGLGLLAWSLRKKSVFRG